MNLPASRSEPAHGATAAVRRLQWRALVVACVALIGLSWWTASDVLAAICVALVLTLVLAARLKARQTGAWVAWLLGVGAIIGLARSGHARLALDLVPVAVNLLLGLWFGASLGAGRTPVIARFVSAIEGAEHLRRPGVARYARRLTLAWTLVFLGQVVLFALVLFWWLPHTPATSNAHTWLVAWLHAGGYLLPAAFMLVEYVFRRWHLRHVPHMPAAEFAQALVRQWPAVVQELVHPGAGVKP